MTKTKYIFFTILLLLLTLQGKAQYNFRSIDTRSGLCDNFVRSILKDQQGFMWFGTMNGITRYDGFHNRPYKLTQKDGRANNNVLLVQQDKSGQLWVTTYDGTLFCYNESKDCMEPYASEHLAQLGIHPNTPKKDYHKSSTSERTSSVVIDQDKNLWFIDGKAISYYIFDDHRLYRMNMSEVITSITCHNGYAFALSAKGHLYRINPKQKNSYLIGTYPLQSAQNLNMYQDSQDYIWVFDKYLPGLYRFYNKKMEKMSDENISSIAEDAQGNMWLGTNSNGISVRQTHGNPTTITRNESAIYPLTSNHINTIYIDDENLAWIGSSKVGIAYTNLNNTSISLYSTPYNEDIGFLCQDTMGKLWIGYDGSGLLCMDTQKHLLDSNSPLACNLVIGGRMAQDNNMYLGTYGGGIYRMTPDNQLSRIGQEYPQLNYARRVILDKEGNLWVGGVIKGLCEITHDGKFHNFTFTNSIIKTNAITDMFYSEKEDLLLIATGTGLYTVDKQKKLQAVNVEELKAMTINVVCIDNHHLRWVCTNDKVSIYDENFKLLKTFGKAEDLNNVLAMTCDQQGKIWLTTCDAIFNVAVEKKDKGSYGFHLRKLVAEDGLGDITFCKKAIYCTKSGDILAGGCGKYVRLIPSQLEESMKSRKVIFTELHVDGELAPFSSSSQQPLEFEHGSDLSFYVSTLDFSHAASVKFAYRMDAQGEWTALDDNHISLANLSYGNHTLQVKALDGNEDSITSIQFYVRPPFGLSGSAICVYILLILMAVYGFKQYQKHKRGKAMKNLKEWHGNEKQDLKKTESEWNNGDDRNIDNKENKENEDSNDNNENGENKEGNRANSADRELINRATTVIEQHLSDTEFSVEDFSEEMNLSRSALYKKLIAVSGKSPLEFMRAIRLEHGFELIQQGNLSVTEIAYQVGLSPKQFSKFFKEEYGCLPSQFKTK